MRVSMFQIKFWVASGFRVSQPPDENLEECSGSESFPTPHSTAPRNRLRWGSHPGRCSAWVVNRTCPPNCPCTPPLRAAAALNPPPPTLPALAEPSLPPVSCNCADRDSRYSVPGFGARERNNGPGGSRTVGGWDHDTGLERWGPRGQRTARKVLTSDWLLKTAPSYLYAPQPRKGSPRQPNSETR